MIKVSVFCRRSKTLLQVSKPTGAANELYSYSLFYISKVLLVSTLFHWGNGLKVSIRVKNINFQSVGNLTLPTDPADISQ